MLNAPRLMAGLLVVILSTFAVQPIRATTTELIVADRNTGLAISGFDPVAYFVDRAAMPGSSDFECSFGGAVWRFRNEGNRAAFLAHPEVYLPRYGGYDPVGVARGVAVAGHPQFWLIANERLYLFYSPEVQAQFALDPERISATADRKWLSVRHELVP